MAYQLNFTEITLGRGTSSFTGTSFRLPGLSRATLFKQPKQLIRRRGPGGIKQIERPTQFTFDLTLEGEFQPGQAWTDILSAFMQRSTASGTGTAYTPDDSAPVEFYMETQLEGGAELYSLQQCVLVSLSIQWQAERLPVFRAEWKLKAIGAPEALTVPAIAEASAAQAIAVPQSTNVYFRKDATSWGANPPTAYAAAAQAINVLFTRDIRPAQFNRNGYAERWEWSAGLDVSGRITAVLSQATVADLYGDTALALIRVDMPTVQDGAQGFYFDLLDCQVSIGSLPILADEWAMRIVEFVNVQSSSGHSVTFYDGQ